MLWKWHGNWHTRVKLQPCNVHGTTCEWAPRASLGTMRIFDSNGGDRVMLLPYQTSLELKIQGIAVRFSTLTHHCTLFASFSAVSAPDVYVSATTKMHQFPPPPTHLLSFPGGGLFSLLLLVPVKPIRSFSFCSIWLPQVLDMKQQHATSFVHFLSLYFLNLQTWQVGWVFFFNPVRGAI